MQPDALEKLAKSNTNEFEAVWMQLVESGGFTPEKWARYEDALRALAKQDRGKQAETLAWAAIEALSDANPPATTLKMAGPLLRAVGESEELRGQVVALYRSAYGDQEGFEALLEEAGLVSGRPVRRALRTLEVCLSVSEGDFLGERDYAGAARVDGVDTSSWTFKITSNEGEESLGAVELADRFFVTTSENYRVLMHFFPERLQQMLAKDPASIVVDLCRENGNTIDSEKLQELMVPEVMDDAEWKKWWTKARNALKALSNVQVEGRSPYYIAYTEKDVDFEDQLIGAFVKMHDPVKQVALVEEYARDCQARGDAPSTEALGTCCETLTKRASAIEGSRPEEAFVQWLAVRRIGQIAGGTNAGACEARSMLERYEDDAALIASVVDYSLQQIACEMLIEARPDDWKDILLSLMPKLAMAVCDWAAKHLIEAGVAPESIIALVQPMISSPVDHFEALLWLWNGVEIDGIAEAVPPVTVLSRILRGLEECRLNDHIPRSVGTRLCGRARNVLGARKCERFAACVEMLEPGMAKALRRQLDTTDSLGRAVREDMLRILDRKFPRVQTAPAIKPWERKDALYVTAEGLARKQDEIAHHVNVKMRDNARAIGEAAEKGDLSENSEYKFALEERDLLRARLAQMNAEVAASQVLRADDVPDKEIGVGSRAVFRRVSDDTLYEITFLGPWEADFDQGVLNYCSPLGIELMGKRIGDTIEFDHRNASGAHELVELHNALTEASNA